MGNGGNRSRSTGKSIDMAALFCQTSKHLQLLNTKVLVGRLEISALLLCLVPFERFHGWIHHLFVNLLTMKRKKNEDVDTI